MVNGRAPAYFHGRAGAMRLGRLERRNFMSTNSHLLAEIRQAVEGSLARIRAHPFIQDANRGLLTREQAVRWIMCAGRESRTFPLILERMIAHSENAAIRAALKRNLDDEHGHGD